MSRLLLALLLLLLACAPSGTVGVVRVLDGDTIDVRIGDRLERVRLIGVDTPEVYREAACFGSEASAFTRSALPERARVQLEKDVSERDQYGRLLRYVYLLDGRMLNELLVAEGYAQVVTFPPDIKYVDRFLAAQQQAREEGRGLWSTCVADKPPPAPTWTPMPVSGRCDPSYPDVCIPPPPLDLDCPEIPYKRFRVLPADPHRFDGDKDGIGCER